MRASTARSSAAVAGALGRSRRSSALPVRAPRLRRFGADQRRCRSEEGVDLVLRHRRQGVARHRPQRLRAPARQRAGRVPAVRVDLLPAPQRLYLAARAGDVALRRLAFGRAVDQQPPAAVVAPAHRRRAEHPHGQCLQPFRQRGVIDVEVDGAQAVAQDAGVERVRARPRHGGLGRVAPRARLPSAPNGRLSPV
jgi:hypothetical protein